MRIMDLKFGWQNKRMENKSGKFQSKNNQNHIEEKVSIRKWMEALP